MEARGQSKWMEGVEDLWLDYWDDQWKKGFYLSTNPGKVQEAQLHLNYSLINKQYLTDSTDHYKTGTALHY